VVSQLVTIRYDGSDWVVEGSVGGTMDTFPGAVVDRPIPAGTPQFNLTFTPGASPVAKDVLAFVLMGASDDADRQKRLLFGDSDRRSTEANPG